MTIVRTTRFRAPILAYTVQCFIGFERAVARIAVADAGLAVSPSSVCSESGTRLASFCRVIGSATSSSGNDSS